MKKNTILWQVLLAIGLAVLVGSQMTPQTHLLGFNIYDLFSFLGKLFLNALTLLVVPLVASAVISGLSHMGRDQSFGRLGAKTFFFYLLTTLLAVLTGIVFVNLISPGQTVSSAQVSQLQPITDQFSNQQLSHFEAFGQIFTRMIPVNIFEAASSGNMLGIIFFSLLFGFALAKIRSDAAHVLSKFWEALFATLMKMTQLVMKVMPIGVFCLVAKVVASQGAGSIEAISYFFLTVILALIVFMGVVLPLLLRIMGLNPYRHFRAMAPALVTAFSTSSSAATLPVTMECVEKRAGVSNRICSFVVPLGTSVNMAGSALYECVAVLFIAQMYGVHITFLHQFLVVILSLLTSIGIAGIPSGSLVAILIVLNTLGLPAEALGLILPVDRILDMCRTTVNVFSDTSCAVIVAQTEGEKVLKTG